MRMQLNHPSLLIALPHLQDPQFIKTVILLIRHNVDGALGLIINRPMQLQQRDIGLHNRHQIPPFVPIWHGGPVSSSQGLVVHNWGGDQAATAFSNNLRVSASEEAMDGLLQQMEWKKNEPEFKSSPLYPCRFVSGYSSWAAKQLDQEIKEGHWYQRPIDEKLVFDTPWQEIWANAVNDLGVQLMDIAPAVHNYLN